MHLHTTNTLTKKSKIALCLLFLGSFFIAVNAQATRTQKSINDGWHFLNQGIAFGQNASLVNDDSWEKVNIPHTWNAKDPFDDDKSYKRGIAWYRKTIEINNEERHSKRHFLHFEGVNQVADVYVNGIHVGTHKGGYTAFTFDISKALNDEEVQLIAVMVDNSHDPYIAPLSVGYALYGGIYRDVWLLSTDKIHFDMENYGSNGIFISTPDINSETAKVSIDGAVINENSKEESIIISTEIYDASNKKVGIDQTKVSIKRGEKVTFKHNLNLKDPILWSPDSPNLYTVKSIIFKANEKMDVVENPLGLRWFSIDADKGFSLNGKPMKLKGTNRHQDKLGQGSALTNREHINDLISIKEMGCNFLRLAHYPQDPAVLKAADELGLLIWEEVPLVNYMTIHPEFLENSKHMLKEMIRQHYNHPSVVIWGSMNEIFLWGNNEDRIRKQTDSIYTRQVAAFAKELNHLIKEEDPSRFSTLAMHMSDDYNKVGIEDLPDIASYNIYSGWYGGKFEDFGNIFDRKHQKKPNQRIFISEYGAGSDMRLNSKKPERFDFTGQYQKLYHESYLRQIKERPYIFGSAIWNQFDFSQPHVGGSIPHLNQKGMATWDRKNKDVYYLYKANWTSKPMVHIAEKDWTQRSSSMQEEDYEITVYSNLDRVTLYHNGNKIGTKQTNEINKATWMVSLKSGENNLRATVKSKGNLVEDFVQIKLTDISKENSFAINIGSNAQYTDKNGFTWIHDSPYNDFYGYHNGVPTLLNRKYIINGSNDDPMYYTYLDDLKRYELKLENGIYNVSLYFIENERLKEGDRVFDVSINDSKVIENFDLTRQVGFCYGVEKTFKVNVTNNQVLIEFDAVAGKTTLSGLKLEKLK